MHSHTRLARDFSVGAPAGGAATTGYQTADARNALGQTGSAYGQTGGATSQPATPSYGGATGGSTYSQPPATGGYTPGSTGRSTGQSNYGYPR